MSQRERYWRGVIRRQGKSGQTVVAFCQREGVSTAAFYAWRKRLREQAGSGTGRAWESVQPEGSEGVPHGNGESSLPLFLPVSVSGDNAPAPAGVVEIQRGDGITVRVFEGASRQLIADVLSVLEGGA
jgi:hypothetical protein